MHIQLEEKTNVYVFWRQSGKLNLELVMVSTKKKGTKPSTTIADKVKDELLLLNE